MENKQAFGKMRKTNGSAILEMALVLPLLIMLLLGVVEFGRVLMVKQVIINAAREGARAGAIRLDDSGALSTALSVSENYLTSSGVSIDPAIVNSSFVTTGGSSAIQVTIAYDYSSSLTDWIPGIPQILTLQAAVTMRREA